MKWLFALVLGAWVAFMAVATFFALEWALRDYADYDRGLWEGAAVVVVMDGCTRIAHRVLNRGRKGS